MVGIRKTEEITDVKSLQFFQCNGECEHLFDVRIVYAKKWGVDYKKVHTAVLGASNSKVTIGNCGVFVDFEEPTSVWIVEYVNDQKELRLTNPQ